ncbi:cold-shock protein, partial [Paracidovorax cattleyae]|uniref:cold-shock protein n=1 Tax=Paracidovorax cattleyae TaxID=80868 RepID=UPI001E4479E1
MQFDGVIASWNGARGSGFIEPLEGGDKVFIHIKAFRPAGCAGRTAAACARSCRPEAAGAPCVRPDLPA